MAGIFHYFDNLGIATHSLKREFNFMDVLFHLNNWFGPIMAAGPLFIGATILIGENLYIKKVREMRAARRSR
ncbi:hypothetical protein [Puniceicoccus vermicola]|uniref:Uncharacterized protein n=1 Tax=Puniceicoccus vermicola TaxID=388746 RepID=A0A7X1B4K3_9BACT|nr:hypothetical protein [Puniceicoccus vermicola]MBC2604393.1 hypothetical protein [Puniceicoccus vermicola]